ncbi:MAG: sirohydrochlorin cobaltochelatase [Nitrospirae bacterium]|nr:sirohydrochlorin cobaltochelatase [Nitrospirota bacterium]MBF0533775.1 sirohydrochlorin cobaltochelatase [Nitrospirota bacterium]MBF0615516.1 sirohydrochlorin cobaltochelatase [Nitrospirota bacterium]
MKERKLKKRNLQQNPAIVIAAFGTTSRGKAAYDRFDKKVREQYPAYEIRWAYTSEIIREKTGIPGILQTLAQLEDSGYRKAIIQPLQIFPGTEYHELIETCRSFPGMRIVAGETLLHRWQHVHEVFALVSQSFLKKDEGFNIVVAHGTPLCADPANILYLSLESYISQQVSNSFFATVDGFPDKLHALNKLFAHSDAKKIKNVRLIPFMFISGLHFEHDLMGDNDSFKTALQNMGYKVECLTITHENQIYSKGLGFYEGIPEMFINRIERAMSLMEVY